MSASISTTLPIPRVAVFDVATGELHPAWYRFFLALLNRTGGGTGVAGVPGGAPGNVQFNQAGAFGGLTNTQLTALVNLFNSTTKGAVPASGGLATTFLNGAGAFTPIAGAPPTGTAGGDLAGTYPNPTVAKINTVALGSTTATAGNLLVGSGTAWVTKAVSGDATLAATGALTFATVNAAPGTYGDGTHVAQIIVNAKGLATTVASVAIAIPAPLFGTTILRPSVHPTGTIYFDTDLGLPVWWAGTQWVNATGAPA